MLGSIFGGGGGGGGGGMGIFGGAVGIAGLLGAFDPAKTPDRSLSYEVNQYLKEAPTLLGAEQTYAPQYGNLYNQLQSNAFNGPNGALALYQSALPQLTAAGNAAQASTLQNAMDLYRQYAPQLQAAYAANNPQQSALLNSLVGNANTQLGYGTQLDPVLQRNISQQVRAAQAARGMGYGQGDAANEALASVVGGQNLYQTRLGNAATAAQLYGNYMPQLNTPQSGSYGPGPAMLQQLMGYGGAAAGYGTGAMGSPYNAYSQDLYNTNLNKNYNYNQVIANIRAQGAANVASSANSALQMGAMACWVAREVFGTEDGRWLQFRAWLLTEAPARLRTVYLRCGERFARKLRSRPALKAAARNWMEQQLRIRNTQHATR